MSESIDFVKAQSKLENLLAQCKTTLCSEAVEEVQHYIDNNEPEIAFEGLFIELMQLEKLPEGVSKEDCISFGKYLKLAEDSVLDDEFWENFTKFMT